MKNKNLIITISGMSCSNCARTIEKSLSTLPNIIKISVNAINNSALIEAQGQIKVEDIKNAISDVGYFVTNIEDI